MQKKKQYKNNTIKQIILYILLVVIILLITFSEDIIKLANKGKVNLAENSENGLILTKPNSPHVVAGMIPVKWNGTNWIITTKNDEDWYDYKTGKPAYIMLNNGTYQSELVRNMEENGQKLAEKNVNKPIQANELGTIFMWIPRFVYKDNGEIAYIKEETTPGEGWLVPEMFSYAVANETKPDFSLSGLWIEKDIDTEFASKITEMKKEEGIYGFLANTKSRQIIATDINELQKFVGNDAPVVPLTDITNKNRIILQIVNTNKFEPIKAKITHNTQEQKLEIRVTYTSNGISKILNEYGEEMSLTKENGIIYTDTGDTALASGTYYFTVIDNKRNKKELSITINVDSFYKVAYINGTDNMDNLATYTKTQEAKTTEENILINQLNEKDSSLTYSKAIKDSNGLTTAIMPKDRNNEDEQLYLWNIYKVNTRTTYTWKEERANSSKYGLSSVLYFYTDLTESSTGNSYTLSNPQKVIGHQLGGSYYTTSNAIPTSYLKSSVTVTDEYFRWSGGSADFDRNYYRTGYRCYRTEHIEILKRELYDYIINKENSYENNAISGSFQYIMGDIVPKYSLRKYDQSLNLLSTYDVDTGVLTTAPINISNKGRNKLKLMLNATGTNYKTYISNDNTNWQEITDITSGTSKELNVDGWDNLYIKIETNKSIINNIDIAYYKD